MSTDSERLGRTLPPSRASCHQIIQSLPVCNHWPDAYKELQANLSDADTLYEAYANAGVVRHPDSHDCRASYPKRG